MTGETHKAGGMLCAIVGFCLLRENNLLLPNVNQLVQLTVMYPFCLWGSTASDLDHHWESCPSKDVFSWGVNKALHITTPLYHSLDKQVERKRSLGDSAGAKRLSNSGLYKVSKFFSASHRSWQTHSDLTLIVMLLLLYNVLHGTTGYNFSAIDTSILSLILTGVCLGIIAHFILDMLTPEGVWNTAAVLLNKFVFHGKMSVQFEKWHFVPKWRCFATGSAWEMFVRKVLKFLTGVAVVYLIFWIVFPGVIPWILNAIPYEITFN